MSDVRELVGLMARFSRAYVRWLKALVEEVGGCHPTQMQTLRILRFQGPLKMADLGQRLGVTRRNVTKLIDGLEEEGLVHRKAMPNDRRVTLVELSEAGRARDEALFDVVAEAAAPLFEQLPTTDRAEFARLIRRLLEGLEDHVC
jgi:DNA-binding MarR family transcriptional regulator